MTAPAHDVRAVLLAQLDLVRRFGAVALDGLTDDEALWRPGPRSWTVRPVGDGTWSVDWEEPAPDDPEPPSAAWVLWHIRWWWSTAIDRNAGDGTLRREDVPWAGTDDAIAAVAVLHDRWAGLVGDAGWLLDGPARWPFDDGRSRADVAAWVTVELMKNLSEIGQLRMLRRAAAVCGPDDARTT